jgi:hypothetical protein
MNDTETQLKKTVILTLLLCAAALALRIGGRAVGGFADFYIGHTNAFWVNSLGRLSSIFPFSLVEILIYMLILCAACWVSCLIILACARRKEAFLIVLKRGIRIALPLAALIFFLFESNEDIGFYRTPFAVRYGYGSGSYSTSDLAEVCEMIAGEINNCADSVNRGEDGIMVCDDNVRERVKSGMTRLGEEYEWLSGAYSTPKPVFLSELMSYTNMAGIFSAYTMEANYNADMTQYNLPFSISHELAHVKGILRENEANFIAYLNCRNAQDADIYYAGMLSGWVYCGNELGDTTRLSMFANRFYMGEFEVTDRSKKNEPYSIRRQTVIKALNSLRSKYDALCFGSTEWKDTDDNDHILCFERCLGDEKILFIGNASKEDVLTELSVKQYEILAESEVTPEITDNKIILKAYGYTILKVKENVK